MRTALLMLILYLQQQLDMASEQLDLIPALAPVFGLLLILGSYKRVPIDVRALKVLVRALPDGFAKEAIRRALRKETALHQFDEGLVYLPDEPKAG